MVDGLIDGCDYHLFAIDKEELGLLLKAHLKTDHKADFDALSDDQISTLDGKVEEIFQS